MKILIVEDDPTSRRILQANLIKWGYEVTLATDGQRAFDILHQPEPPNLVISDWIMPHMDGLTLCREIRRLNIKRYVYFILLTTKGEKRDIIQGLAAGADDFLIKPFNQEELKYRIRIGERIINLEHRILKMAHTDALTGLMNRRAFMERLEQETIRAHRDQTPLSFIISDIDHFKRVNDTYGHQGGDQVLQGVSALFKMALRPYDLLGRYGGEEFVACLPGVDETAVEKAAERLRKKVAEMGIQTPQGTIHITVSFGTSTCHHSPAEEMESLIRRADEALYRAKEGGRNRVCQADEDKRLP